MSQVTLSASMRSNLLSLQKTQGLMDITQERLSTGLEVNSALDNPSAYYTAQSLACRAKDLSALLDAMGQGVQTVQAANEGLEAITTFVQQAKAIANAAKDEANKLVRSTGEFEIPADGNLSLIIGDVSVDVAVTAAGTTSLETLAEAMNTAIAGNAKLKDKFLAAADGETITVKSLDSQEVTVSFEGAGIKLNGSIGNDNRYEAVSRYNEVLGQIDQVAKDAGYKGVNLLQENDITVVFNEDRSSAITVEGVDASAKGLGLSVVENWGDTNVIDVSIQEAETALNTLLVMSSDFGNNYAVIQTREDFTESLINVLNEGADKLTLADMNEESANMLELQTRQQLAINSLSLASQAALSVLKLF